MLHKSQNRKKTIVIRKLYPGYILKWPYCLGCAQFEQDALTYRDFNTTKFGRLRRHTWYNYYISWGLQIGRMWQLIILVYQAMRQCAWKRPQLLFLICEISPCLVWKSLVSVLWGAYKGDATLLHLFTSRAEKTTQTVFSWAKTAPVHLLIRNNLMLDMIAIKKL